MQAHAAWNHQFGLSSGELSRQIEKRGRYRLLDSFFQYFSCFTGTNGFSYTFGVALEILYLVS
jgi:hypothetical protein